MTAKWLAVAAVLATSPATAQGYPLEPPITPAPTLCYTNAPYTIADQYYGYQSYAGDWVTRSIRRRGEPAF